MSIRAGSVGIDFAGARPAHGDIRSAGGEFIIRYSAGVGMAQNPNTHFKLCEAGEIAQVVKDGLDFIANSEWYETRITEGSAAGTADGKADLAFWKSRGLAPHASIYVSWDAFPDPARYADAIDYLRAHNAALGGYYSTDCYAGTPFLRHAIAGGACRYGWRPNAGDWSHDGIPYQPNIKSFSLGMAQARTPAAIWQTGNYWFGKNADENVLLRASVGSHLQALHPVIKPAPTPGAHKPHLTRQWPAFMKSGDYFGLITGPAHSHGGFFAGERPYIKLIQLRMQQYGYAPGNPSWADGKFGQSTADAVTKFQRAHMPHTTRFGQVWQDDWNFLFTW